jgi:hypothetical protein
MEAHTAEAKEAEDEDRLPVSCGLLEGAKLVIHSLVKVRIAVWASLISNLLLSGLQRMCLAI